VRVRDHVFLSTGGAAFLVPWLRGKVFIPWAASILIDVDHYLWFCVHERSVDPLQAVRFFDRAQQPQYAGTHRLHHPAMLLLLLVLSARWRWAELLLIGMAFHVGLDVYHTARLNAARCVALRRDRSTCQTCGARGPDVVAHQRHQPPLLPSYRPEHLISLCSECHEVAHGHAQTHTDM
jgi:hypothetical protein